MEYVRYGILWTRVVDLGFVPGRETGLAGYRFNTSNAFLTCREAASRHFQKVIKS